MSEMKHWFWDRISNEQLIEAWPDMDRREGGERRVKSTQDGFMRRRKDRRVIDRSPPPMKVGGQVFTRDELFYLTRALGTKLIMHEQSGGHMAESEVGPYQKLFDKVHAMAKEMPRETHRRCD